MSSSVDDHADVLLLIAERNATPASVEVKLAGDIYDLAREMEEVCGPEFA